jgi:hypothetical protein
MSWSLPMAESILTPEERALLAEHGEELLELEERYGSQEAVLNLRPDLVEVAKALQRARAQSAANKLGLTLRGDGRPFDSGVLADLELVFRQIVAAEDDPQPVGGITSAASLARLLHDDALDQGAK